MKTRRVLFVGDDAALGKMVSDFLSDSGYEVRTTETGYEAVQQLVEFQPHLIVLDIGPPDISGLEILGREAGDQIYRDMRMAGYPQ